MQFSILQSQTSGLKGYLFSLFGKMDIKKWTQGTHIHTILLLEASKES